MNERAVVVFSGYNNRAVLAFIRTLSEMGAEYYVVACNENDAIFQTTYKNHIVAVRKAETLDENDVYEVLRLIADKTHKKLLIAPSTEALNRFLLDRVKKLEDLGCIVPLVDKWLYETISDKKPFSDLCKAYGIKVPFEYTDPAAAPVPFVAKPKSYYDRSGNTFSPVIIYNDFERRAFLQQSVENYYYQEFVGGGSYYLLYYISRCGDIYKLSQENLIQQPGGKSIIAAVSSDLHHSLISEQYESMLVNEGFYGLVMIEVRGDRDDLFMIEANPRFWGPSQLFVDNAINLFIPFLLDYGVVSKESLRRVDNKSEKTRYFWGDGMTRKMQLDYHNYSSSQFELEYDVWVGCDIYRRSDVL